MDLVTFVWPFVTYKVNEFVNRYVNETILVQTKLGPIKGLQQKSTLGYEYAEFRGIPYAKPPLGNLRFKDPEPIEPWTEPILTTVDTYCCQKEFVFKQYTGHEDCLHLNVYTRNLHATKLYPVIVCIHGGGFQFGSNTKDIHNPEFLLKEDIVFVAINYRLGALGFLSIDDPDCEVPGNAGLKDQVLALKWIQENISIFGGDPGNVTILGNSAGGASVHYHMISEMSRGLFHKAICMSGTALNFVTITTMKRAAEELGKLVGWDGKGGNRELLRVLRSVKAKTLVDAQDKLLTKKRKVFFAYPYVACIEPYVSKMSFIPKQPTHMNREPWNPNMPLMIGGCSHEGLFLYKEIRKDSQHLKEIDKDLEQLVPMQLVNSQNKAICKEIGEVIKAKYFGYGTVSSSSMLVYLQMLGDILCWHGLHRTIMSRQHVPGPTYIYRFSFDSPSQNHSRLVCAGKGTSGASHADDCSYLFKYAVCGKVQKNSREFRTIERMVKFWTSFAHNGDPNNEVTSSVHWQPLAKGDKYYCLNIADELTYEIPPELERMQFWDDIFRRLDLELF